MTNANITATLKFATLAGNTAGGDGHSLYASVVNKTLLLTLDHTILISPGDNYQFFNSAGVLVLSRDYTISNDNSMPITGTGNLNATDPMLGPLQDNGGETLTHMLLSGSPAFNSGDPAFVPPPATDQRGPGYPRLMYSRVDIGALEVILEFELYLPLILK